MAEGGRRDFALLTEGGGSLAMRPLYADLDEKNGCAISTDCFGRGEKV